MGDNEDKLRDIIEKNDKPIPQKDLEKRAKDELGIEGADLLKLINGLLSKHLITVLKNDAGVCYASVNKSKAARLSSLSADETQAYNAVKESGDMGVRAKDIRFKTNMNQGACTRALQQLERKNMIKPIKSIQGRGKVYMLFDIEPNLTVKGNAFYDKEGKFDEIFVKAVQGECLRFIALRDKAGKAVTVKQITEYVNGRGVSKVEIKAEDIRQILFTLKLDEEIEEIMEADDEDEEEEEKKASDDEDEEAARKKRKLEKNKSVRTVTKFRISKLQLPRNGLTETPCGRCPVFEMCTPNGDINPRVCPYLTEWLRRAGDTI